MELFDAVKRYCIQYGFDRIYYIALSGGLDSIVLFDLLVRLRMLYPLQLRAIHVHHGLSRNADAWLTHCETRCKEDAVIFSSYKVPVRVSLGESVEEIAREERYNVFSRIIEKNSILMTAHHQDDQAETVLLQLFRGAGPKGLSAMGRYVPFAAGFLGRPLLDFSRETLLHYAKHHQLFWVEDESNLRVAFTRNFIRHEVIPLLQSRWPSVSAILARTADHCAETQDLLEYYITQEKQACSGSRLNTLSVEKLLQLEIPKQRQIIRLWIIENQHVLPSTLKLQHILSDVLHAGQDRSPSVAWGKVTLRRYRDDLYLVSQEQECEHDGASVLMWDMHLPLALPSGDQLQSVLTQGEGLRADIPVVSVRFRQGGEHFLLPGRLHHHSLKKLFQQWGVPPWERNTVPLIFVEDELAVVVGYAISDRFKAEKTENGFVFRCSR